MYCYHPRGRFNFCCCSLAEIVVLGIEYYVNILLRKFRSPFSPTTQNTNQSRIILTSVANPQKQTQRINLTWPSSWDMLGSIWHPQGQGKLRKSNEHIEKPKQRLEKPT